MNVSRAMAIAAAAGLLAGSCLATPAAAASAANSPRVTTGLPVGDPFVITAGGPGDAAAGLTWTDTRTRQSGLFAMDTEGDELGAASRDGTYVAYAYGAPPRTGIGITQTSTGATTRLTSLPLRATATATTYDYNPHINPSDTTVAYVESTNDAVSVKTVPISGGAPTTTSIPLDAGSSAIGYAADGGILYGFRVYANPTCAMAERLPTGTDSCLLTAAALGAATGLSGSVVHDIGDADAAGTIPFTTDGYKAQMGVYEQIGVFTPATGSLRLLPATRRASNEALLRTPYIDDSGTEVLFDEAGGLFSAKSVVAVDVATGTHLADVVGAPNLSGAAAHVVAAPTVPSTYHTLPSPARLVDTRDGTPFGALGGNGAIDVPVAGTAGIPADATAVLINLSGTASYLSTYLQAYPTPASGSAVPTVSTVNLDPRQTAANAATVPVGADGEIRIRNNRGSANVIVDVVGYYAPTGASAGSLFDAVTPSRVLDTRNGMGGVPAVPLGPQGYLDLRVAGTGDVPADANAVVLNVGALARGGLTYVSAYPTPATPGNTRPTTSTLNLAAGETRANQATVTVGSGGRVRLYNNLGSTDVFADVAGYYTSTGTGDIFVPVAPTRIFDTRNSTNEFRYGLPIPAAGYQDLRAQGSITTGTGAVTIPTSADAIDVNVTAVVPSTSTFLALFATPASDSGRPTFSTLDVAANDTVANAAITRIGVGGQARLFNNRGTVHAVVDMSGYFEPATG